MAVFSVERDEAFLKYVCSREAYGRGGIRYKHIDISLCVVKNCSAALEAFEWSLSLNAVGLVYAR